jgi:hypothetical protein
VIKVPVSRFKFASSEFNIVFQVTEFEKEKRCTASSTLILMARKKNCPHGVMLIWPDQKEEGPNACRALTYLRYVGLELPHETSLGSL